MCIKKRHRLRQHRRSLQLSHVSNTFRDRATIPLKYFPLTVTSAFSDAIHASSGSGNASSAQCSSELNSAHPSTTTTGSSLNDSYLGKRRTANHPCPVCGKHYVNEGSLRKHLACHAETSQLTSSLRMWPCSVCQAVFTHENGKYRIAKYLVRSIDLHMYVVFK